MARCLDPTLKSVGASYEQCCRSGFRLTGYEYEIQNRPSINLLRKTEGKKLSKKERKKKITSTGQQADIENNVWYIEISKSGYKIF